MRAMPLDCRPMTGSEQGISPAARDPQWVRSLVQAEPRAPLMAPYMGYLLLLLAQDIAPPALNPLAIALHIALTGWIIRRMRHHFPALGGFRPGVAIVTGLAATVLWVGGQHVLNGVEVAGHALGESLTFTWRPPFVALSAGEVTSPREMYGGGWMFWTHVALKIARAVTVVPIVEELFWRGFLLRAFIHWDRFETVPMGQFSWFAFLGTSLLSVAQHPANWGVSIPCWMLYNGVFYWTGSLRCLMLTHAITNLALYAYVVQTGDWQFW